MVLCIKAWYNREDQRGDNMALSKQKAASNRAYQAKLDVLKIQPHKAEGAAIRAAAAAAGQSVQAWLLQAARERMAREAEQAPPPADQDD